MNYKTNGIEVLISFILIAVIGLGVYMANAEHVAGKKRRRSAVKSSASWAKDNITTGVVWTSTCPKSWHGMEDTYLCTIYMEDVSPIKLLCNVDRCYLSD